MKSSLTQLTGMSSSTAGTALAAKMQSESSGSKNRSAEAFMSIQLEKVKSLQRGNDMLSDKTNNLGFAKLSDQPGYPHSLIWSFSVCMKEAYALYYPECQFELSMEQIMCVFDDNDISLTSICYELESPLQKK